MLARKRILLIITGGIAAYKCLDLIRRLRERGVSVRCVMTEAAHQFVTPMSVSALTEDKVYSDMFSLTDESEMGHIQLSRDADLLLVAPATADILARMHAGMANDLATTTLLATDKPVMVAPAMNVRMWHHPATQRNLAALRALGVRQVGPGEGAIACNEFGMGRMAEPAEIIAAIEDFFADSPLQGLRALVTSGPTVEAIDPVRFIANRSSGKQGHAIAAALAGLGADTTLVSGPVNLPDPDGVATVHVESARDMLAACKAALPADVAVCAAAVADWRIARSAKSKIKKTAGGDTPTLAFAENPDILATLSKKGRKRPRLVVGFAAETDHVLRHAKQKLARKGCDWILANDVSPETGTFGGDANRVHLISAEGQEDWPAMSKVEVAERLASRVAEALGEDA